MINFNQLEPGIRRLVQTFIESGRPSVRTQTLSERRQGYVDSIHLAGEELPIWSVADYTMEGIRLRVYRPSTEVNLPMMIYYHGGCFVSGDLETHDRQLRHICRDGNVIVVAVDYRLAPEHPYPAAHDDALHAAQLVRRYGEGWGGNSQQITLAGDSAGGHLALVTCLRLKALGAWLPARQILIYPMLDASLSSDSYTRYGEDYIITKDTLLTGYEAYMAALPHGDAEASPLYRDDLAGLPDTHILTAQFDPLVDEGEELYRRLLEAGVQAQCRRYFGVNHGFFQLGGISQAGRSALRDVASIMRDTE
ncbi:alpha/beta hydrolase [Paenibacillus taiwanensis]|uniref:alpha/beta hydrolase n=1 Tax=Paenibacillus taiwanensis TaxID=401638 RepID=UPI0012FC49FC|nr:alpha/beta hydrolase [Paenibacillus taiwanensis]